MTTCCTCSAGKPWLGLTRGVAGFAGAGRSCSAISVRARTAASRSSVGLVACARVSTRETRCTSRREPSSQRLISTLTDALRPRPMRVIEP